MEPHIIGLDLDGTVVDYDDRLSDRVRAVIRACRAAGHHVVIATGRGTDGALDVANRLGLQEGFLIASNGSVIIRLDPGIDSGWRIFNVESFDPAPALERMAAALPTALLMVEDTNLVRWASAEFPVGDLAAGPQLNIVSFDELKKINATRIVLRDLNVSRAEFGQAVEKIGLHGVTYSVGWSNWLDIAPEGISKASGLQRVATSLGVERQHTVGAGDGSNDMEMMRWVAHGIAMGQAGDELKALATVVTGHVDDDGLADALVDFFSLTEEEIAKEMR